MLERKKRKPDKTHVARKPDEVAKYKKRFLEQLKKGCAPGVAARNVNIARCTAYNWRTADPEFDAAWTDAVETALDLAGQVAQYGRGAGMIESVARQLVTEFADALAANMQATPGAFVAPVTPAQVRLDSLVARAWWRIFVGRLRKLFSAKP